MQHLDLTLTLTGGLTAALLLGYITHRLGLSPIVGYLLAGVALGPHTPGFEANHEIAEQLAEIGVILLMFGVGLHFHLKELLAVRHVAVPGADGQSIVATLLGCLVAVVIGWGWSAGIVFGLAISVASMVVLLRVLADNNDLHTPTGHIDVGWLIVEDLFTVLVLVLLPVIFQPQAAGSLGIAQAIGWSVLKIGVLVAAVFVLGGRVLPWILNQVAATRSRELFTLAVLVLALGLAVGAAKLFGVSMALGAFLAGMVVGQSDYSSRAASEDLPMRDAFAVLFFVSVGMLFNPLFLLTHWDLVAMTLAIVMIGKPLGALAIVVVLGYPFRTALAVAIVLAQIGEFSFILAVLGRQLSILPDEAHQAIVAAAILSISANPLLYRLIDVLEAWAKRSPRLWRLVSGRPDLAHVGSRSPEEEGQASGHVIVVGYGPVGRTLVRLLVENEIVPIVVELNMETVRRLRDEGVRAVYGDITHKENAAGRGRRTGSSPLAHVVGAPRAGRGDSYFPREQPGNPRHGSRDVPPRSAGNSPRRGRCRLFRRGGGRPDDDRVPAQAARRDGRADRPGSRPHPQRALRLAANGRAAPPLAAASARTRARVDAASAVAE